MRKMSFILMLSIAVFYSFCGELSEKENKTKESKQKDKVIDTQEKVELSIEANDAMRYNLKTLYVPVGSRVKLTLRNVGNMPKEAMGHNWTLLKAETDLEEYAMHAMKSIDNDYQPKDRRAEVIDHTRVLGPGRSETIEFDAPDLGTYKFICTFPGHFKHMQGDFIVE